MAAVYNDFTESEGWVDRLIGYSNWKYRDQAFSQSCGYATTFASMFEETVGITTDADLTARNNEAKHRKRLAAVPQEPKEVKPPRLPAFIWFPRNGLFRTGVQLCPEEFKSVIGADIELKSVMVQLLPPTTPLDERIPEPAPPWLAELRRENAIKPSGRVPNDAYHRLRQVEGAWF